MKKKIKRRRHKKCKIDATHETNKKEEQVHSIFNKQKSEQIHIIEYRVSSSLRGKKEQIVRVAVAVREI